MGGFTESVVEDAALAWLEALGYAVLHGPDIAAGEPGAERSDPNYRDVVLDGRLREALARLNPDLPPEALEDAYRKLTRCDAPVAGGAQPRAAPDAGRWRDGRVPAQGRLDRRGAGARHRLRHAGQQRLAGGQPVHRGRRAAHAAAGRGAVRQRAAAGGDRAEEPGRRERDGLVGVSAAPDVPGADPGAVHDQRGAGRLGRRAGAHRRARRGQGVVQALADDHRARGRAGARARAAGGAGGCVREAPVPRPAALLHRLRGLGRRQARQEDGRLPPVPRGQRGGGRDAARRSDGGGRPGLAKGLGAGRRGSGRAASRATGGSGWCGTRRARARA